MRVGIITGSGSHRLPNMSAASLHIERTRFGEVELVQGTFAGVDALHLSRHGEGHVRLSSHVNHRANITALVQMKVDAVLAVTVGGALDPTLELGGVIVFDDLYYPSNRLPDGTLCTLHNEPGAKGRGYWIFEQPFSQRLRGALLGAARARGYQTREEACYGYVDGPPFNSPREIRALRSAGVVAVSQSAGPEAVLAGESGLPYPLVGYLSDYANGVVGPPTSGGA